MPRALRIKLTTAAFGLIAVATISAAIKFTSTFKSLDAGAISFTGRKVAALVISNDLALRMSAEEALVRELASRGMLAVATYRMVPKEELSKAETLRVSHARLFEEGDYEAAIPLAEHACSILEKELGEQSEEFAGCLIDLGLMYSERGDYGEAEPLYQRAWVAASGPLANFLLAIVLLTGLSLYAGRTIVAPMIERSTPQRDCRPISTGSIYRPWSIGSASWARAIRPRTTSSI